MKPVYDSPRWNSWYTYFLDLEVPENLANVGPYRLDTIGIYIKSRIS